MSPQRLVYTSAYIRYARADLISGKLLLPLPFEGVHGLLLIQRDVGVLVQHGVVVGGRGAVGAVLEAVQRAGEGLGGAPPVEGRRVAEHLVLVQVVGDVREVLDALEHLLPEVLVQPLDGPGGRRPQGADAAQLDVVRNVLDHVHLRPEAIALPDAVHDVGHHARALAAGGALVAALVLVEHGNAGQRLHEVRALVHDNHRGGPQGTALVHQRVEVHQHIVADALGQHRNGAAARDHRQQVVPAAPHAAAVLLQQLAQGDAHALLHRARRVHVAGDAEQLRPAVVLAPEAGEPLRPAPQDRGRHGDGLDVGDDGGAAVEPDVGREGGLQAGLAGLALQALDQPGLLAADVCPGAPADHDVELVAGAAGVVAQHPGGVRLLDRRLHGLELVVELAAAVDVGRARAHREPGDEGALDQLVRLEAHDLAVLARSRLRLVGVDDDVRRAAVRRGALGHERPLEAGGEPGATAAAQSGLLDLVDNPIRTLPKEVFGPVVVTQFLGHLDPRAMLTVDVLEDAVLVLQEPGGGLGLTVRHLDDGPPLPAGEHEVARRVPSQHDQRRKKM
mmetsp:Transcript_3204/g.6113  ORF Transcript_3204/g.6113 Transcript_3204/m.6113 type:complete len:562 (+) Transcript_3204:1383-3068(+)